MIGYITKSVFISTACLLIASSCSYSSSKASVTNKTKTASDIIIEASIGFPETTEISLDTIQWNVLKLKGKQIIIKNEFIDMKGSFMAKKDNLIFFRNALYRNFDYYYLAYSLPDFKLVNKFGTLGGGPNEFGVPHFFVDKNGTTNIGFIFDTSYGELYKIKNDLSLQKIETYKELCFKTLDVRFYTDTTAFYLTDFSIKGLFICRFCKKEGFPGTKIHDLQLNSNIDFPYAYHGFYGYNFKQDRLIYAYEFFREIHILDTKGNLLRKLKGKGKNDKKTSNHVTAWMDNLYNPVYYRGIFYQSDHYIYLLNNNEHTINDWLTNKVNNTIIEQYDWNGNPMRRIELDKRTSSSFSIDEKEKKIYLLASDEDDPLYIYDLPDVKI